MASMSGDIRVNRPFGGEIIELVISRPETGNALNAQLMERLSVELELAEDDPGVAGVLLSGEGREFCLGGDVRDSAGSFDAHYPESVERLTSVWMERTFPVVTIVGGRAQAFGCALALTSDVLVVTTGALFSLPELGHGVIPVYAITLLAGLGAEVAMGRLLWSGDVLSAGDLSACGMCGKPHDTDSEANAEARRIVVMWAQAGSSATRTACALLAGSRRASSADWMGRASAVFRQSISAVDVSAKQLGYLQLDV